MLQEDSFEFIKSEDISPSGLKSSALKGGGVPMYQHKYTNENGEFDRISIIFADGIKLIPSEI